MGKQQVVTTAGFCVAGGWKRSLLLAEMQLGLCSDPFVYVQLRAEAGCPESQPELEEVIWRPSHLLLQLPLSLSPT